MKNNGNGLRSNAAVTAWLGLLILFCLTGGCRDSLVSVYTVRGVLVNAEQGTDGSKRVTVLHEAIPEFKNQDGTREKMSAMVMTFPAGPDVSVEKLRPKDKMSFELEVNWTKSPPVRMIELHPLDPAVKLDLEGYSVEMDP